MKFVYLQPILVPATRDTRCRYAELPELKGCFGPATVFMSHCWGAAFGDLIGAACHGARTDRVVWIDIFAVRPIVYCLTTTRPTICHNTPQWKNHIPHCQHGISVYTANPNPNPNKLGILTNVKSSKQKSPFHY